jgi:putative peptidoglycan lipid II flippase
MTGNRSVSAAGTVLGAAAVITVLTVLARTTGFARNLVFAKTVGFTCLADTYTTVNTVPNILFEVVAGGALASLVVPLLAQAVASGDRDHVARTSSALLTWTVAVLVPVAALVAIFAEPLSSALLGAKDCRGAVTVGAFMLRVFAPQIVLYGIGLVLTGILQAHGRFTGPAVAPMVSSAVVIVAYLLYDLASPYANDVDSLTTAQELVLSVGTTLGVVALSMCLLVPLGRTGVRLRVTFHFPDAVAAKARGLAYAGVAVLGAQQLAVLVGLLLGNGAGVPNSTVAVYWQAQTLFLLPWAVLAVPVATTVFPRLTQAWARGDVTGYRRDLGASTTVVLTLSLAATAALVAAAQPLAAMIALTAPGRPSTGPLAAAVTAFAFGLPGYALFALLSRALYASGETRRTAVACVSGWAAVIIAAVVLAATFPTEHRAVAIATANSIGMTVLGALLALAVGRRAGLAALAGTAAPAGAALAAAVVAALAGRLLASAFDIEGTAAAVSQSVIVAGATVAVFTLLVAALARRRLRAASAVLLTRAPGVRR